MMVYERMPVRTLFATTSQDGTGISVVRLVLRFLERGTLHTNSFVRDEAEAFINCETANIAYPVQVIADYE
jgi:hypothetical protein